MKFKLWSSTGKMYVKVAELTVINEVNHAYKTLSVSLCCVLCSCLYGMIGKFKLECCPQETYSLV